MSLQHSAAIEASPNSAIGVPETELRSRASSVGLGMRRERRFFSGMAVGLPPTGFTCFSRFYFFNGAVFFPLAVPSPLRLGGIVFTGGVGLVGSQKLLAGGRP